MAEQMWWLADRADHRGRAIADRHYNRQAIGAAQFVAPGACLVLTTSHALWVSLWPRAEYVKHAWAGAWINQTFRREAGPLASEMIIAAVAATLAYWPDPPELGMVTFVDPSRVRRKRDPGRCYKRAGFEHVGFTKGGLWAYQLKPDRMPPAMAALGSQMELAA